MEAGVLLGIDHGGSTTTALILDPERGKSVGRSVDMPKSMPREGWAEHDPEDFLKTSLEATNLVLAEVKLTWADVGAIGIANQGETSMVWSSGNMGAVGPAISWEDRRTTAICEKPAAMGLGRLVREWKGVLLDPYFTATKFRWLLDEVLEARGLRERGALRTGSTDGYVIDRLTVGEMHATHAATASRTALLNLRRAEWDDDLLVGFGLEELMMPQIRTTSGSFGVACPGMTDGVRVLIAADTMGVHAAMFASDCHAPSIVNATYSTGAFIEVNTGTEPVEPDGQLLVFIAWDVGGQLDYTLEVGVFAFGSAIDWMARTGIFPSAAATFDLANSVEDDGALFHRLGCSSLEDRSQGHDHGNRSSQYAGTYGSRIARWYHVPMRRHYKDNWQTGSRSLAGSPGGRWPVTQRLFHATPSRPAQPAGQGFSGSQYDRNRCGASCRAGPWHPCGA